MLPNCNGSLRVPPLLAYDLSNLDVILLLFLNLLSCLLTNLTTASLLYNFRRYCKTRKLSGCHDFMTHYSKIRISPSIFMRNRNI